MDSMAFRGRFWEAWLQPEAAVKIDRPISSAAHLAFDLARESVPSTQYRRIVVMSQGDVAPPLREL